MIECKKKFPESDLSFPQKLDFKTIFNYCSCGSDQNSIVPVVCDEPE